MQNAIRFAAIVIAMGALVGCGGAQIGSKEEAARVAFNAGNSGNSAKGGLMRLYESADSTGTFTTSCSHGGTVSLAVDLSGTDLNSLGSFKVTYEHCVEPSYDDPQTETVENEDVTYDGTITMTYTLSGSNSGVSFGMKLKGRIDLSGAISDFVDMDITQTASVTVTSSGDTASVKATTTIDGSVKTSNESYVYDNETYDIAADGKVTKVASNP